MTIITGAAVMDYRKAVLLRALKLEVLGMKHRGPSVYSIVKREFGLKGSKESVYEQFKKLLESES